MYLNAHLRLQIPPTLGQVLVFDTTQDPSTGVPDIIAFQNDGDIDVTLHFDAGNNKAQVSSSLAGTYNISTGTNDQLLVSIDGEAAIAITLTGGAARTAAQVAADINTAFAAAPVGSATSQALALVESTKVAIISGSFGTTSSVSIQAPATHSANATIGFVVGTLGTPQNSFLVDIVSAIVIQAKGTQTFTNPRRGARLLQIRGQVHDATTNISSVIDATTLFRYSGVQQ